MAGVSGANIGQAHACAEPLMPESQAVTATQMRDIIVTTSPPTVDLLVEIADHLAAVQLGLEIATETDLGSVSVEA